MRIWLPEHRISPGTLLLTTCLCRSCLAADAAALSWAKRLGLPIFATRPDADLVYTDWPFASGAVFVLGSEAEGLSPTWLDAAVTPIRLPMCGVADSLNASAVAAVLVY